MKDTILNTCHRCDTSVLATAYSCNIFHIKRKGVVQRNVLDFLETSTHIKSLYMKKLLQLMEDYIMNNQPATLLTFKRKFSKTTISAKELNDAIITIGSELYSMRTDSALLYQELVLLKVKLPEGEADGIVFGSVDDFLAKIIETSTAMFSAIITVVLTAGATTNQLDFMQAVEIACKTFGVSIIVIGIFIVAKKLIATVTKARPVTAAFNTSFRLPLIQTISYMLIHQSEMNNIDETELLAILRRNIVTQAEEKQ